MVSRVYIIQYAINKNKVTTYTGWRGAPSGACRIF
jgi:hypothetical protein